MDLDEVRGLSVFIVDDNPNNLNIIKDHLIQKGLKPTPLKSGEAAIDLIDKIQPDIILLDVQMSGGIDGYETCRKLKSIEKSKDIPVIFVSAYSETVDKVTGFAVGGVDYVTKPIDMDELLSRIYVHNKIYNLQKRLFESKSNLEEVVKARTEELEKEVNEHKKSEERLRRNKNYLTSIIESMPSMLISVNTNLEVIEWNSSTEQVTHISSIKARGKPAMEVVSLLRDEEDTILDCIESCSTKQSLRKKVFENERTKYVDIFIYPLISDGVEGAVIRVDDITNRVHMEEIMIQSEKMLSIGGLAAGMAHEINNPLAGILQCIEVIEKRLVNLDDNKASKALLEEIGISSSKFKKFIEKRDISNLIEKIKASGKRLSGIVNNMLGFVYNSQSKFSMHSITEIMDQCIELAQMDFDMKKKYDFKNIEIVKKYKDNLSLVSCEKTKLEQVFLNILQNGAMAMMEDNTTRSKFIIEINQEENFVRIDITDNGPGVNKDIKNKVFDPFFTTKAPGIGTGLGLSISYYIIVEEHKGSISILNEKDGGARFIIRIPI